MQIDKKILVVGNRTLVVDLDEPNNTRIDGLRIHSFILDEPLNLKIVGIKPAIARIMEAAGVSEVSPTRIEKELLDCNPLSPNSFGYSLTHARMGTNFASAAAQFNSMEEFESGFEVRLLVETSLFIQKFLVCLVLGEDFTDAEQNAVAARVFAPELFKAHQDITPELFDFNPTFHHFPRELFFVGEASDAITFLNRFNKTHSRETIQASEEKFMTVMLCAYFACNEEVVSARADWQSMSENDGDRFEDLMSTFMYPIAAKQKIAELLRNFFTERQRTFIENNSFRIEDRYYSDDKLAYKKEQLDFDYVVYHCVDGEKVRINRYAELFARFGGTEQEVRTTKTYVVFNPASGLIKIGKSVDVDTRIRNISTMSGSELELLHVFDDNRESKLHRKFSDIRVHGEWFTDDGRIRDYCSTQQETV